MTLAVFALSILLVLIGAVCIAAGIPIVHLEQGWTEIIAGSIAGAAGCVIFVLGVFLNRFDALRSSLDTLLAAALPQTATVVPEISSAPSFMPAETNPELTKVPEASQSEFGPVMDSVRPEPALAATFEDRSSESEPPSLTHEERAVVVEGPPLLPPNDVLAPAEAHPEPTRKRPNFLTNLLARRSPPRGERGFVDDLSQPLQPVVTLDTEPDLSQPAAMAEALEQSGPHSTEMDFAENANPLTHSTRNSIEDDIDATLAGTERHAASTALVPDGKTALVAEPAAEGPAALDAEPPQGPTVVGRYNAGSASYVMYSNGMIEVETETGVHQFESMQELKVFIANQEAAGA